MEPFDIGKSSLDSGDFDSAVRYFTEAIRSAPLRGEAYDYRGCAFGNSGHIDSAVADFTEAIRLCPTDAYAYHCRGLAHYKAGRLGEAVADLSEAVRLNRGTAGRESFRVCLCELRLRQRPRGFYGSYPTGP